MTKIIGHRGARGLAAENTLAAIEAGLAHGAEMIEIDVRVTADGVPVVVHDRRLAGKRIAKEPYAFLKILSPDLITLEAALRFVAHRAPVVVEVKPHVPLGPIAETMEKLLVGGWRSDDFLFGSKSQRILRDLHQAFPQIQNVVIERFLSVKARIRARQLGTRMFAMNQHFLRVGFVAAMHRRGYELFAYTLNDPAKAARWTKFGLAGIITDYPDRFAKPHALAKHSQRSKHARKDRP